MSSSIKNYNRLIRLRRKSFLPFHDARSGSSSLSGNEGLTLENMLSLYRRTGLLFLLVVAVLLFSPLSSGQTWVDCLDASDCTGAEVCEDQVCMLPCETGTGEACAGRSNAQCSPYYDTPYGGEWLVEPSGEAWCQWYAGDPDYRCYCQIGEPSPDGAICNSDGDCLSDNCEPNKLDYCDYYGVSATVYRCTGQGMDGSLFCVDDYGIYEDADIWNSGHFYCNDGWTMRCSTPADACNTGYGQCPDPSGSVGGVYKCYCNSGSDCQWSTSGSETTSAQCSDGIDNDCDNMIDNADPGCCDINQCESYGATKCSACDYDDEGAGDTDPDVCNWANNNCCETGFFWNTAFSRCDPEEDCGWPLCWGNYCISGNEACCDAGGGYEYRDQVIVISA